MSAEQLQLIRKGLGDSLKALRPNLVTIADAWQFSDRELR